ncbi:adenosylcobinamide amidohydrolase [Paenibacillus sp. N1-5-1-14]|uniref:adenosylcobinamide amidohydrolase n=1 Tax=Paenibacillus radicibacter TaxID=2972488 RepID=UPI00215998BC|nr:adenosylcobinamide amidohydrolase [Paenibacillus radicibacter]MCR8643925.1 adenosylcobinamide amidohydrolase [Paenibacillus radicibacter]
MELREIEGVTSQIVIEDDCRYVLIQSEKPLHTLSTNMWGGGYGEHALIMNRQVPKSYMSTDPVAEMKQFLQEQGFIYEQVAGMLTAAYVVDVGYKGMKLTSVGEDGDQTLRVSTWVTMGLGNTTRAGLPVKPDELYPGTINIIVLIDGDVTDAAMASAIITATEAKTAVLQDLGVKVKKGSFLATGTSTDAIVIAATGRGRSHRYAGTATWLGHLIGRTVYEAAMESGRKYEEAMMRRAYG